MEGEPCAVHRESTMGILVARGGTMLHLKLQKREKIFNRFRRRSP